MPSPARKPFLGVLVASAILFASPAIAQTELKIIAPAAPGGGSGTRPRAPSSRCSSPRSS